MSKILVKVTILFVLIVNYVNAGEPEFSFETNELDIPVVMVDGIPYSVKMHLIDDEQGLTFTVTEANNLPSFEERFESLQNGMTRQEVIEILGVPQNIKNLEIKVGAFCSEPTLEVGSVYEQWEYGVDRSSQAPSGFVVWFSEVDNPSEWEIVGKLKGFSCM